MKIMIKKIKLNASFFLHSLLFILFMALSGCITTNGDGATTTKDETSADERVGIYAQLARGYMKEQRFEIAQRELRKALEILPNHSESNYIMGLLMIELKQYSDVDRFMTQAVKHDPNNAAAAHDYGVFLCQTGKELRSINYFDKAVANPFFARPELSLMRAGECLYKVSDFVRAEKYLKRSLSVNPKLHPALLSLAKIKYEARSYLSARAYIERFYAITKPQPVSLLLGYKIELALKANDVAEKYRVQLLETFPASDEARDLRRRS